MTKMAQEDGGPAFPRAAESELGVSRDGMSLRDWFAGQSLAAIIAADGAQYFDHPNDHARTAYAHADAMLRAARVAK